MFVLPGVFGCVTSLGAMVLGISVLTGISPRINLGTKAFEIFILRKISTHIEVEYRKHARRIK